LTLKAAHDSERKIHAISDNPEYYPRVVDIAVPNRMCRNRDCRTTRDSSLSRPSARVNDEIIMLTQGLQDTLQETGSDRWFHQLEGVVRSQVSSLKSKTQKANPMKSQNSEVHLSTRGV
jgi:hypothetical protein